MNEEVKRIGFTRGIRWRAVLIGYALIAPAILWRFSTTVYPFLHTLYLSFFEENPIYRTSYFIGLENYVRMFKDKAVIDTLAFTLIFTVGSVFLQVCYGMAVASLLNAKYRGRSILRAANLLPWAMPTIVAGTAAVWFFHQDFGMVNDILWRLFGIRPAWLVTVPGARAAVTFTDVWKNGPFLAIIFLGGLQGIPGELYEAARVDGATGLKAFWHITLPLMTPLMITMSIFVGIYRILSFDIIYALTQGGPGTATSLMSYRVFLEAFRFLNFGYGSALAVGAFVMILIFGLLGLALLRYAWAKFT
ncbi:MAG: carbohydrate ABC transporter permease [bacterium]